MADTLHPDLVDALHAVDRGEVRLAHLGQRRIWLVAGRRNTPAIQSLLDSGLVEEDRECQPPIAVTDKGRTLLDTLNPKPEGN